MLTGGVVFLPVHLSDRQWFCLCNDFPSTTTRNSSPLVFHTSIQGKSLPWSGIHNKYWKTGTDSRSIIIYPWTMVVHCFLFVMLRFHIQIQLQVACVQTAQNAFHPVSLRSNCQATSDLSKFLVRIKHPLNVQSFLNPYRDLRSKLVLQ